MADETPVSQPPSQDETLAQLKGAIQALEVLADRLDGESIAEPETASPVLAQLTDTVANLTAILEPSATEPVVEDETVEEEDLPSVTPEVTDSEVVADDVESAVIVDILDDVKTVSEEAQDRDDPSTAADTPVLDTVTPDVITSDIPTTRSDDWGDVELGDAPSAVVNDAATDRDPSAPTLLQTVVQKIRGLLPPNLNELLSDTAIAVISGSLVVVLLWGLVSLSSSAPNESIADVPETAPNITEPTQPTPTAPTVPATPSRKLRLTPEQKLIASIQKQVSQITEQYAEGLIQSLQVDFLAGRLRVTLSEGWYGLEPERQDQVAAEVLKRSRRLDFTKVEMVDDEEHLLARSPIVGDRMIIFQRVSQTDPSL